MNGERIEKANNEQEIWKIVKEINNPTSETIWSLKEDNVIIKDEQEIANVFNHHFVDKITKLKDNIDKTRIKEPLSKLKDKMKGKNLKFSLKTVTERKVKKDNG